MTCDTARALLSASADGELDLRQSLELDEHTRGCAVCSRESERLLALRQAMHEAAPVLRFTTPIDLENNVRAALRQQVGVTLPTQPAARSFFHWLGLLLRSPAFAVATALLLVALGFGGGYFWARPQRAVFINEVVASHVRSLLLADHLLDVASSDQHTVKPWFNGRLDFAPPVSDLAANGFPLAGGRLDYLDGRSAAALVYRHDKHVINLFVQPTAASESTTWPPRLVVRDGFHLLLWTDRDLSFCAVSDLNELDLRRFAETMRQSYR